MNERIIDEIYQLAGGEVPLEKIKLICSSLSPDGIQELVEIVRQGAAEKPELVKSYIWAMFAQEYCFKKGYHLLYDEEGKPLPDDEEKIEEALATFREALPYLEYVIPQTRVDIYITMIRAYQRKYKLPKNYPGKGGSPEEQEEFVEVWNAFQKLEESWSEYERTGQPPEGVRKDYESLMEFKPDYLFEALIRLEGYKDPDEIYEMREEGNPEEAIKEWEKWLPYREEVFLVRLNPTIEFFVCIEFLTACIQIYRDEPSNYPDEDFNYAWEAIQSARRIWKEHHEDIWENLEYLPMSKEEYEQTVIEGGYQKFASEHSRRTRGTSPQPETQTQKSGGCFIATAVYGSEDAPTVLMLRSLRDDVLLSSKLGRVFVNLYYLISPPVARLLSNNSLLQNIARKAVVRPIANLVRSKLYPN